MNSSEEDRMLKEILANEELEEFRQSSLTHSLNTLRRDRQRQRAWRMIVVACVPLIILGVLLSQSFLFSTPRIKRIASPGAPAGSSEVKTISDEELFALFPGRSLALIGEPGSQQLVFLDSLQAGITPDAESEH